MNIHLKAFLRIIKFFVLWFGTIYGLKYILGFYFDKDLVDDIITIVESLMVIGITYSTMKSASKFRSRTLHLHYSNYIHESMLIMAHVDVSGDKELLSKINEIKLKGMKDLNEIQPYPDQNKFNEIVKTWENFNLNKNIIHEGNFPALIKLLETK